MFETLEIPIWVVVAAGILALIAAVERMLIPPVRWFLRRRMERFVERLNTRLERPIAPFKLARRSDMTQRLLYHPDVMKAVSQFAEQNHVPENVAFERAKKHARTIVPSFSALTYYALAEKCAKSVSHFLYDVRVAHFNESPKENHNNATLVFVMNHRSNMDYVLVTYLAARKSTLSYAVGEWGDVWPLNWIIRATGAYFISRKPRGALYRSILTRYVQMATQGGVAQAIFPEGGLSLDGKLQSPKLGILSDVISAWQPEGRDVVFVPVALNYDRVFEDQILIDAAQKGQRRFHFPFFGIVKFTLKQFWLWLIRRRRRFGVAAAQFGRPLSLHHHTQKHKKAQVAQVAQTLLDRINAAMPILPVPFAALMLIRHSALTYDKICAQAQALYDKHRSEQSAFMQDDCTTFLQNGLDILTERGLIIKTDDGYCIAPKGQKIVPYYAATLAHL